MLIIVEFRRIAWSMTAFCPPLTFTKMNIFHGSFFMVYYLPFNHQFYFRYTLSSSYQLWCQVKSSRSFSVPFFPFSLTWVLRNFGMLNHVHNGQAEIWDSSYILLFKYWHSTIQEVSLGTWIHIRLLQKSKALVLSNFVLQNLSEM